MHIVTTIIIGFLIGLLARFIKPGNNGMGFILTTLVGIGGAFVGAYLGQIFGIYQVGEPAGFIGATVGAIIILMILNFLRNK